MRDDVRVSRGRTAPEGAGRGGHRHHRWAPEVVAHWGPAAVCLGQAAVAGVLAEALPWAAAVLLLAAAATTARDRGAPGTRRHAAPLLLAGLVIAAVGAVVVLGLPALPLLLVPVLAVSLRPDLLGVARLRGRGGPVPPQRIVTVSDEQLRRLHRLADALEGGFAAPSTADKALDELADRVGPGRATVLVAQGGEHCTPVALRGTHRVPWPDPAVAGSVLHPVWTDSSPLVTTWSDEGTEHALLAVPVMGDGGRYLAVLVADRPLAAGAEGPPDPRTAGLFGGEELAAAEGVAARLGPALDIALLLEQLRSRSALEERARLSAAMHDGIAQELAALGYQVDAVRARARREGLSVATSLDDLRGSLTAAMTDIRMRIADLRAGDQLEARLGAAVSTRLQSFGAVTGISTTTRLTEGGFRLPAHLEVLFYRLVLDVLEDARRSDGTSTVTVELDVTAPEAEVRITHDGMSRLDADAFAEHPLTRLGAGIEVTMGERGGTAVRAHLPHLPRAARRLRAVPNAGRVVA